MKILKSLWILLFILQYGYAQKSGSKAILNKIEQHNLELPIEKLYLSFDKPYYNVGDTVWFKSYLLNADNASSNISDRLYVELFNDSSLLVERRVIVLENGLGYGDFSLGRALKDGSYTIRAYTNWQQNFGSSYFFQQNFYIGNAGDKTWLLAADQKVITEGNKKSLDVSARITNLKNEAAGYRDIEIFLMNNQKKISRTELQTTVDGSFNAKIPLPDDKLSNDYSFLIVDKKDKLRKAVLPLVLADLDEIDLQFMPEGGLLVNEIYTKVAFKAIGTNGLGKNISGQILNSKKEEITQFVSSHNGMGNFYILPQKGETYFAVYKVAGKEKQQQLPLSKDEGTSLRIDHLSKTDSLIVYIKASASNRSNEEYSLIAQAGDSVTLAVSIKLNDGFSNLRLPKNIFPDGIIHFTLFSPTNIPLNERSAFINWNKKINLKVDASKQSFAPRDSISLEITATNEEGIPLKGSFSISVTDDKGVIQPTQQANIISHYLLQSNLKGNIEDPSWYFNQPGPKTASALDNLLLSQGWIEYNWNEILTAPKEPKFMAEKDNIVSGRLTNLFKKPVPNIKLTLLSLGKEIFVVDTLSNENGEFLFKDLPLIDSAAYTIKIKNQKGKVSNAFINITEFEPPAPVNLIKKLKPWYINSDSTALTHFINGREKNRLSDKAKLILSGIALKEVEIKAQNPDIMYNIAWDAKFKMEIKEEDLKKTPQKTLMDLLSDRIPGFKIGNTWYPSCYKGAGTFPFEEFVIGANIIASIKIDNHSTFKVVPGGTLRDWFDTNQRIFNILKAADITNIKLYKGCVYYYLSITTRSGSGPWVVSPVGTYVYRPLPINPGRKFYSAKYAVSNFQSQNNERPTIFWDANVVTDEYGIAKVSFYATDKSTTYTVKIEGSDLSGRFGAEKTKLTINGPQSK
jgi:hypothetical protein